MTMLMSMASRFATLGLLLGFPALAAAQAAYGYPGSVSQVAPAWQPASGGAARGTIPITTTVRSGTTQVASGGSSPYYNDSPIYRSGMMTSYIPQTQAMTTPVMATTAPLATGRPAIVPEQMIQPMVQTPNGLVPGQAATTPIQTTSNTVTPTPAPQVPFVPAVIPSAPSAPAMAQPVATPVSTPPVATVPVTPASIPNPTAAPGAQPFVDPNVFAPAGQSWMDVDISPYVSRFPAGAGAERSVQEWILKKYGNIVGGNQVSSLVVTSERVRLYQTPAVQQQVLSLLGRFLYYTPGEFQTQVRVINTRDLTWRAKYGNALEQTGQSGARDRMWLISAADAKEMIEKLGEAHPTLWEKSGLMLTNPDPVAYNGQHVVIDWSPQSGHKCDPQGIGEPTEDGVLLNFSPLIDTDAATIEMAVSAGVRRTGAESRSAMTGAPTGRPEVVENQLNETILLPPGKVLMFSLGEVPSFDNKRGLLGKEKLAEVLVFIACQPSPSNSVKGQQVQVAQVAAIEKRVAARPSDTAREVSDSTKLASAAPPTSKPEAKESSSFADESKAIANNLLSKMPKMKKPSTPFVPPEMTGFVD